MLSWCSCVTGGEQSNLTTTLLQPYYNLTGLTDQMVVQKCRYCSKLVVGWPKYSLKMLRGHSGDTSALQHSQSILRVLSEHSLSTPEAFPYKSIPFEAHSGTCLVPTVSFVPGSFSGRFNATKRLPKRYLFTSEKLIFYYPFTTPCHRRKGSKMVGKG